METYAFAQRSDTSYLRTIPNEKREVSRENFSPLKTDDIDGCQPKSWLSHLPKKEPQTYTYAGSSPSRLHPEETHKPCFNLTNLDIEGSRPRPYTFKTNRRVDPLSPDYPLPSYQEIPPVSVEQRRVTNDLADLPLAHPKPALGRSSTREIIDVHDIGGTTSQPRTRVRQEPLDCLEVRDITHTDFKSSRTVDPLSPRYVYDVPRDAGFTPDTWEIGTLDKTNHPKPLPAAHAGPFYPLHTTDIEGCEPGYSVKMSQVFVSNGHRRRQYHNTNFIADIRGTHPSDKRRVLSQRSVDPLNPAYKMLDSPAVSPYHLRATPQPHSLPVAPSHQPDILVIRNSDADDQTAPVGGDAPDHAGDRPTSGPTVTSHAAIEAGKPVLATSTPASRSHSLPPSRSRTRDPSSRDQPPASSSSRRPSADGRQGGSGNIISASLPTVMEPASRPPVPASSRSRLSTGAASATARSSRSAHSQQETSKQPEWRELQQDIAMVRALN